MDYFLNTSCSEGLGVHWAWDGISLGQYDLTSCSLCKQEDCEVAEIEKCYQNRMWYVGLATSSRYKCINQKQSGRRNVIAFVGDTVVVHLGSTPRKLQAFLILIENIYTDSLANFLEETHYTLANMRRNAQI